MLHGCASTTSDAQNWTVEPFQRIKHATNRPDGYYSLGRYYQGQNRLDLAAGAYRKALAIDPNFTEAHNGLGTIYALQGKYKQALAEFNSVIARTPDAAHIHNNIGYLNFLEGNYAEAVAAFTRATALDPANQKAWNNLGMALARNGEPMKSNQAFTNAIENAAPVQSRANSAPDHAASDNEPGKEADQAATMLAVPKDRGVIAYASSNKPESNVAERPLQDNTSEDKAIQPATLARSTVQPPPFAVVAEPNPKAMPIVVVSGSSLPATEKVAAVATVAKAQPNTLKEKPAETTNTVVQPHIIAANLPAAEKTESKTQVVMARGSSLPATEKVAAVATVAKAQPNTLKEKPAETTNTVVQPNIIAANLPAAEKTESKTQVAMASPKVVGLTEAPIKAVPSRVARSASVPAERNFVLEVSNGNGINKLAAKFRAMLAAKGLPKASLTNQKPFNQARTVIHYRKGYLFEAARLGRHLRDVQNPAVIVESKNLPAHTDVKLVLGKDLYGKLSWVDKAKPMTLASR
jgi:Tfp pilus assembly protein PilF